MQLIYACFTITDIMFIGQQWWSYSRNIENLTVNLWGFSYILSPREAETIVFTFWGGKQKWEEKKHIRSIWPETSLHYDFYFRGTISLNDVFMMFKW